MLSVSLDRPGIELLGEGKAVDLLKAREPCIFHAERMEELETHRALIRHAITKTGRVVLSVPERIVDSGAFSRLVAELPGLFAISVKYRIAAGGPEAYSGLPLPGREGDLRVVDHYLGLVDRFSSSDQATVRVIPEIEVTDQLQLLGPTLMALARSRPPWMVMAAEGAPEPAKTAALRDSFEYLRIRNFPLIDIHFTFRNKLARNWAMQSDCIFTGPEEFHIDLTNRCTHSCVYCALYAPAVIEDRKASKTFDAGLRDFMQAQLDEEKALELIHSLPVTTRMVQLGGAGDPMLHPKAFEIITSLRERGVKVEVLSNMEYLKEGDHEVLNALGGELENSLRFIVNLSAATPETYVRTRPRQTPAVFHKVVASLKLLSGLRERSGGRGAHFTMMCILNRLNFHEAPRYVELAKELGAAHAWFKPLEIHHRLHYDLLPRREERPAYALALREALEAGERLGVEIMDREAVEDAIRLAEQAPEARV